jgi:hypothetical protein
MPKEKKQSDKPSKAVEETVPLSGAAKATLEAKGTLDVLDIKELKNSVSVAEIEKHGFKGNLPKSIDILPSIDHSGESALDVIVVFPNGMPEEKVASPQTSRMLSWIQDTILSKAGSGYWPYVFVKVEGCPD